MQTRNLLLASLIATLAAPALAGERPEAGYAPLRPLAECFDPDRARSWHLIDSDEVLVDAGRRRFHLQLQFSCPELGHEHAIVFRAGTAVGRLCGHPGDAIVTAPAHGRRTQCPVASVTPLAQEEYEALLSPRSRRAATR
jgi:hypothetical protein